MKESTKLISLYVIALFGLLLISACGNSRTSSESTPYTPSPIISSTVTPRISSTPKAGSDGLGGITIPGFSNLVTAMPTIVDLIPSRTPAPTATPDAISDAVSDIIEKGGVSENTLLWLKYADWVNLGISLFFVFVGYLIGTWMIRWLLPRLVQRTRTNLDDLLLQVSGNQLRWLAVVLIFRASISRLTFISVGIKEFISDITFFISLFLIMAIFGRLIDLIAKEAETRARKSGQHQEVESLITLSVWALRFILLIFLITFSFGHYAVDITGVTLFLGIIILVLSIASRDLLADIISGVLILIDRPYRIGDRLELPSIGSWGDVIEIGMRSTKIRAMDNRMLVLPNSQIGKNEVINYSYRDTAYHDILDVLVAFDNDPKLVEQLLREAILSVDKVQKDRKILTWLMEFNETHMLFWAGWWVESYLDRYPVHSEVSMAIIKKFKEAGIAFPYRRVFLNPNVNTNLDIQTKLDDT